MADDGLSGEIPDALGAFGNLGPGQCGVWALAARRRTGVAPCTIGQKSTTSRAKGPGDLRRPSELGVNDAHFQPLRCLGSCEQTRNASASLRCLAVMLRVGLLRPVPVLARNHRPGDQIGKHIRAGQEEKVATAPSRTIVRSQPKRSAIAAHTPPNIRPWAGRKKGCTAGGAG